MNRKILFSCALLLVVSTSGAPAQNQTFPDGSSIIAKADRIDTLRKAPRSMGAGKKYSHATPFQDGRHLGYANYRTGAVDAAGNVIIPFDNQTITRSGDIFLTRKAGRHRMIDAKGNTIGEYDFIANRNGLFEVRKNGKRGVIDSDGKITIPLEYDFIANRDGLFEVRRNGKRGVIDSDGKIMIPLEYDYLTAFDENGVSRARKNGLWGLIDKDNRVLVDFKHAHIGQFVDGIAEACVCEDFVQANNRAMVRRYTRRGYVQAGAPNRINAMCKNPVYSQLNIKTLKK